MNYNVNNVFAAELTFLVCNLVTCTCKPTHYCCAWRVSLGSQDGCLNVEGRGEVTLAVYYMWPDSCVLFTLAFVKMLPSRDRQQLSCVLFRNRDRTPIHATTVLGLQYGYYSRILVPDTIPPAPTGKPYFYTVILWFLSVAKLRKRLSLRFAILFRPSINKYTFLILINLTNVNN